jgi:DNA-binding transcriptional ArsR family regulator
MDDEDIDQEASLWASQRTAVDDATWNPVTAGESLSVTVSASGAVELRKDTGDGSEIVDAVIVDDDPRERVYDALRRRSRVPDIAEDAGCSRPTVYRHLKALRDQGLATSPARGVWIRTDAGEDDAESGSEEAAA